MVATGTTTPDSISTGVAAATISDSMPEEAQSISMSGSRADGMGEVNLSVARVRFASCSTTVFSTKPFRCIANARDSDSASEASATARYGGGPTNLFRVMVRVCHLPPSGHRL